MLSNRTILVAAASTLKARRASRTAHGIWQTRVIPCLRDVAGKLAAPGQFPQHRFLSGEGTASHQRYFHIQGKIVNPSGAAPAWEKLKDWPSKLVYAIDASGAVTVSLFAHRLEPSSTLAEPFLIDTYPSAKKLDGILGRWRIRKHVKLFLKLCNLTLSLTPKQKAYRFVTRLERKHGRLQKIFESRGEYRKRFLNIELAIGAGMVAGLYPLVFSGLLVLFGQKGETAVKTNLEQCMNAVDQALCLNSRDQWLHEAIAAVFSPIGSHFFAVAVCGALLVIMKRRFM